MQLTPTTFKNLLRKKEAVTDKPFLLSLDCDRTLVDRSVGSHFISPVVAHFFQKLKHKQNFVIVINTGRDWNSYQPLSSILGTEGSNLFLSGRVLHRHGEKAAYTNAILSPTALQSIVKLVHEFGPPFLDVKTAHHNIIWRSKGLCPSLLNPFKPTDWMTQIKIDFRPMEELNEETLLDIEALRIELPIPAKAEPQLFNYLRTRNREALKLWAQPVLPVNELELVPVPSRSDLSHVIATIRIMCSNTIANKGIGLRQLAQQLRIPEQNIIAVGDSNDDTAGDCIIKAHLPQCLLCTLGNPSFPNIDVILEEANKDGIVPLLQTLLEL